MKNREDIQQLFEQVKLEAAALGIPVSKNIHDPVGINSRATSRYGCCKKTKRGIKTTFEIEISERILGCTDEIIKQTLAHELLHTCPGCDNHGATWKCYASQMNEAYGYNIKRTEKAENLGVESRLKERPLPENYIVVCKECGARIARTRLSDVIRYPNRYRCKCGGALVRIK